jgi:limonene-1,2-epoxide hydrolase
LFRGSDNRYIETLRLKTLIAEVAIERCFGGDRRPGLSRQSALEQETRSARVTEQEQITRKVVEMWAGGLDSTLTSWREHATLDMVWWNNARGAVDGLEGCLEGIRMFYRTMGVDHVKVPIRSIVSDGMDLVVIERSDDTYLKDGSLLAAVPVVGVIRFRDGKIVEWRDYCDDWVAKLGFVVNAEFKEQ